LELILPISIDKNIFSIDQPLDLKKAKENINDLIKNYTNFNTDTLVELWIRFLKVIIFQAESIDTYKAFLEDILNKWNLRNLGTNITNFISSNSPFLTRSFVSDFWKSIIKQFYLRLCIKDQITPNTIMGEIRFHAIYNPFPNEEFDNLQLPGVSKELREIFKTDEKKAIIAIGFIYFVILVIANTKNVEPSEELDGREIICHYYSELTKQHIIPVHPSYKIIFNSGIIMLEGRCLNCQHVNRVGIINYNKNWRIIRRITKEKSEEEFINLIRDFDCDACNKMREIEEAQHPGAEEYWEQQEIERAEFIVKNKVDIEKSLKSLPNLFSLFLILNWIDHEVYNALDEKLLLETIEKFLPDKIDDREFEMLLHPQILSISEIEELITKTIKKVDIEVTKRRFLQIIEEGFSYYDIEDKEYYPSFYKIFLNDKLVDVISSKIDSFTIQDLLVLIKYCSQVPKIRNFKFFRFFKKHIIKKFYPIIEDPDANIADFNYIKENFKDFELLRNFGNPFDIYVIHLRRYIRRFRL